jgi:hypothetical protein
MSADVTAFLLDTTYDEMLEEPERAIRTAALALLDASSADQLVGQQITEMLAGLDRPDPSP